MASSRLLGMALGLLLATPCAPTAHARALADIRTRGVVSLCAHPNALPFASRRGPRPGVQVELARAIADRLGVALELDWVTFGIQHRTADCDLVMDTIVEPDALEDRNLRDSQPYQRSGVALALGGGLAEVRGFDDLNGVHRVGVQLGSVAQMLLGRAGVQTIPFGFEDEMLAAAAEGEIDAAAATPVSIGWWNHLHPDRQLRLVHAYDAEPELAWDLAVGMRRSDRFLRREIDRIVEELMADGTVARVYAAYGIEHRAPEGVRPRRIERKAGEGEETCVRLGFKRECSPAR